VLLATASLRLSRFALENSKGFTSFTKGDRELFSLTATVQAVESGAV